MLEIDAVHFNNVPWIPWSRTFISSPNRDTSKPRDTPSGKYSLSISRGACTTQTLLSFSPKILTTINASNLKKFVKTVLYAFLIVQTSRKLVVFTCLPPYSFQIALIIKKNYVSSNIRKCWWRKCGCDGNISDAFGYRMSKCIWGCSWTLEKMNSFILKEMRKDICTNVH